MSVFTSAVQSAKAVIKCKTLLYNSPAEEGLRMEDTCLETAWLWSWGLKQGEAQSAQDNKGTASFSSRKFIVSLIINDAL